MWPGAVCIKRLTLQNGRPFCFYPRLVRREDGLASKVALRDVVRYSDCYYSGHASHSEKKWQAFRRLSIEMWKQVDLTCLDLVSQS